MILVDVSASRGCASPRSANPGCLLANPLVIILLIASAASAVLGEQVNASSSSSS